MSRHPEDPVQTSLELIEANLSESLTIDWIASEVGVSSFHFQRKFVLDLGETVAGYVRSRRLELAANTLVQSPQIPLIDLALDCGFQTHSAFTRAFHKHFGITPNAFVAGGHVVIANSVPGNRPFLRPVSAKDSALAVDILRMPKLWLLTRSQTGASNGSYFADEDDMASSLQKLLAQQPAHLLATCGAFRAGPAGFSDPDAVGHYGGVFDEQPNTQWGDQRDEISAGDWAAISHVGKFDRLHMTWNKILQSWLPRADYELRPDWMLEMYYAAPEQADGKTVTAQILLPVQKTA